MAGSSVTEVGSQYLVETQFQLRKKTDVSVTTNTTALTSEW